MKIGTTKQLPHGYIGTLKQVAMCEDKELLIQNMSENDRVINWNTLEVIAQNFRR